MADIRAETPEDIASIHHVNKEAFGDTGEAELVDKLRNRGVLTLSLVATDGDIVVGHILFSPVTVATGSSSFEVIGLAPMAVLPDYQRKGIGSQLVRAGLEECCRLGHEIVVVLGHSDYYPRFGFIPAKSEGIDCEFEVPEEAWMVLELREGALTGKSGTVKYPPEFHEAM
ncbi:GNAT family N-acetyltransferase [Chloroflexota bacterium]